MLKLIKNILFLFTGKPKAFKKAGLNKTIDLILNRKSCRLFSDEEISEEDLQTILEAGRFAPSTVNLQTWSFITFTKREWHELFSRPIPFKGTFAVVICADSHRLKNYFPDFQGTPYVNLTFGIFNAGLAAMNMTIAAEALGLRSIMLSDTGRTGLLDFAHLREKLSLPDGVLPLTTLVLGRSVIKSPAIPPRQPWDCIVMKNTYNHMAGENLKDWFEQMFIGFKLAHPLSSLHKQIELYRKKMLVAEEDIKRQFLAADKEH